MSFTFIRMAAYLLATFVIAMILPSYVASWAVQAAVQDPWRQFFLYLMAQPILAVLMGVLSLAVYVVLVGRIERRPVSELGRNRNGRELLAGFAIGIAAISVAYLLMALLSDAYFFKLAGPFHKVAFDMGLSVVLFLGGAVFEEVIYRGIIFRLIEQGFGTTAALVVSSSLFGAGHAWNPNASVAACAFIALGAGPLLGLSYKATGRLWLPIGLHFGWNFAEGGLYGGAVSGRSIHSLLGLRLEGSDLLTGGRFGPEASILALIPPLILTCLLARRLIRAGGWRPVACHFRLERPAAPSAAAVV